MYESGHRRYFILDGWTSKRLMAILLLDSAIFQPPEFKLVLEI